MYHRYLYKNIPAKTYFLIIGILLGLLPWGIQWCFPPIELAEHRQERKIETPLEVQLPIANALSKSAYCQGWIDGANRVVEMHNTSTCNHKKLIQQFVSDSTKYVNVIDNILK